MKTIRRHFVSDAVAVPKGAEVLIFVGPNGELSVTWRSPGRPKLNPADDALITETTQ